MLLGIHITMQGKMTAIFNNMIFQSIVLSMSMIWFKSNNSENMIIFLQLTKYLNQIDHCMVILPTRARRAPRRTSLA